PGVNATPPPSNNSNAPYRTPKTRLLALSLVSFGLTVRSSQSSPDFLSPAETVDCNPARQRSVTAGPELACFNGMLSPGFTTTRLPAFISRYGLIQAFQRELSLGLSGLFF